METGWILGIIVSTLAWIQVFVGMRLAFRTSPEVRRSIEESERYARRP